MALGQNGLSQNGIEPKQQCRLSCCRCRRLVLPLLLLLLVLPLLLPLLLLLLMLPVLLMLLPTAAAAAGCSY